MSGGFAGGLAQGITNGMQLHFQQKYLEMQQQQQDRMAKQDERDAEVHGMKKDEYASQKTIRDRRNNALQEIAQYTTQALSPQPQTANPAEPQPLSTAAPQAGLAPSAPIPANPMGALAPAPQQPQRIENPGHVVAKGMVTGAYTPEMLTNIANIFAKHGLTDEGLKYTEQAYTAQKRGLTQAAMSLIQNNPGAAVEKLKAGGMPIEGMPVKVKPDDPNDHNWKLNTGDGEKTVNVKDLLQTTMDPEKFFEAEDKKREALRSERKMSLDERKQANDDRMTNAQIGYLKSRSTLAEANADKAGRAGMGGLAPSRSSEAQINTALGRRDKAFDRVSSTKDLDTGKFEVDPQKRQILDSAANQYQNYIEDKLGEELGARDHHKFTDAMVTFPVNGSEEQIRKWEKTELLPRFGGRQASSPSSPEPATQGNSSVVPRSLDGAPSPAAPPAGSLASLKDKGKALQAINQEMAAVQQALKTPNLSVEQKQALALKAQDIATRRDSLK